MRPARKLVVKLLVLATAVSACGGDSIDSGGSAPTSAGGSTTDPVSTDSPATTSPTTSPSATSSEPASPDSAPSATSTTLATISPTTEPSDVSTTEPEHPAEQDQIPEVTTAIGDLATLLAVDPSDIDLIRFEPVTWANGALGCPQPDRAYTQALVDGFRIELAAGGVTYWYHGGRSGVPFLCDDPEPPASGGRSDT